MDIVGVAASSATCWYDVRSQRRIVLSLQPTARRVPSGLKATVYTVVPL